MVNNHKLISDDDEDDGDLYDPPYEAAVNDFGTPVRYLMIHQMDRGPQAPRRISLNKSAWQSLSKDDQVACDWVSDAGKKSIVT